VGQLIRDRRRPAATAGAGFTLVEILVVLAIVAIASGAAWLAWRGGDGASLRREAQRLAGAIEYAAERAQWRHEDLALGVDADGFRFWKRDAGPGGWAPLGDDDALAAHAWAGGTTLVEAARAGRALDPAALVAFRASGRNDPLAVTLASGERRLRVEADPLNRVVVTEAP
jgi:general secretion pathway protein H